MVTMEEIFNDLICANPEESDFEETENKYEILYTTMIHSKSIEEDDEDCIVEILYQFNKEICDDEVEAFAEYAEYPLTDFEYVKSIKIIKRDSEYWAKLQEKNL